MVYKSDLISLVEDARKTFKNDEQYPFRIKDRNVIEINGTQVFYIASKHFYIILAESWRAALENNFSNFEALLKKVWDSKELEKNKLSFKNNLKKTFKDFKELVKEQFFYFRNLDNDEEFRFPLYRLIEDNDDVTGGFFHFLIKHFEEFNHIHSTSNDQTEYWPNELLFILMNTSIHGNKTGKREANVEDDYKISKELKCSYFDRKRNSQRTQKFRVVLYYDSKVDLYSVDTFHRS